MSEIEFENYIEPCKQMLREGKTVEDVLTYLRDETKSKVPSMLAIMEVLNITPSEAKILVHRSKAWDDVRDQDERLHEDVISAIEKMNKKD